MHKRYLVATLRKKRIRLTGSLIWPIMAFLMFLHSYDLLESSFGLEEPQGRKKISKLIGKLPECFSTGLANCCLISERTASTRIFSPRPVAKGKKGHFQIRAIVWVSSLILVYHWSRHWVIFSSNIFIISEEEIEIVFLKSFRVRPD